MTYRSADTAALDIDSDSVVLERLKLVLGQLEVLRSMSITHH
jgi:hypothetical protein